jgi:septation ring formation regulator EzrA
VRSEKEVHDLRNSNQFLEKKIAEMNLQIDVLRDRVTESEWNLCQNRESLPDQQQHHAAPQCNPPKFGSESSPVTHSMTGGRDQERLLDQLETTIHMLRDQVQDLLHQRKSSEAAVSSLRQENEDLRYQLGNVREELNTTREGIAEERDQWQQEKQKVLRYQKHLNQNYILVLKRNKEIESELKALKDRNSYKIVTDETKC